VLHWRGAPRFSPVAPSRRARLRTARGSQNQRNATAGEGALAVFNENGALRQTIIGSQLASPWGVALAPAGFGTFGGDLLVGDFSYVANGLRPSGRTFFGTI
jgi:hypothetical protein